MPRYSDRELVVFCLQDLIVDIRCAERDGLADYANQVRDTFRRVWPTRHAPRIDRYGPPIA